MSVTNPSKPAIIWSRVCQLEGEPLQHVKGVYDKSFPIEFRHYFATLIENEDWASLSPDNPNHIPRAKDLLNRWIAEIQTFSAGNIDFLLRIKMMEIANNMSMEYSVRPLELIRKAKFILETEMRVINEAQIDVVSVEDHDPRYLDEECIREKLNKLYMLTKQTDDDLRKAQSEQETFVIQYQDQNRINAEAEKAAALGNAARKEQLIREFNNYKLVLERQAQKIHQMRVDQATKYQETLTILQEVQEKVLGDKLQAWKKAQALQFNGGPQCDHQLQKIQEWCERLAEIAWKNNHQIKRSVDQQTQLPINPINSSQERQPPQVIKTQTRFGAQVRLLIGNKLSMHMNPPSVRAVIVSESQAQEIVGAYPEVNGFGDYKSTSNAHCFDQGTGDILNNTSVMEYNGATGVLSANFRNMSLRRIKRSDRRGADTVTEEKFAILFHATFHVGSNEIVLVARTLSLPIVVIVHGNQEANASASILWDNAFAQRGRMLFQVPEKVPWSGLVKTLSMKWSRELNSKFGLSPRAINFLGQKIFRGHAFTDDTLVTWSMFNRENMPGRTFTFWQWFDSVMALMKHKLCVNYWNDHAVVGFIDRRECEQILQSQPHGTFLMRFSDSELGALSYANMYNGQIQHLKPQTMKDFQVKQLHSQLRDLVEFKYCYTENDTIVEKGVLFSRYFQEDYDKQMNSPEASDDPYVSLILTVRINNANLNDKMDQSSSPSSPSVRSVSPPEASISPMELKPSNLIKPSMSYNSNNSN